MAGYFHTGEGQTVLLGLVFMFVFMAYYMIQGFSANLYGETLGSNMETTLYAVFTVSCFPAPAITNKLGPRVTMFLGIMGYAVLVGASLLYYLGLVGQWAVIAGGAVNGVGAALLWTAQGRLMLQYSDGTDSGRIFAIFWAIFNASAVLGGFITYGYFSTQKSDGNVALFVIFLLLISVGGVGALFLSPSTTVHKKSPSSSEDLGDGGFSDLGAGKGLSHSFLDEDLTPALLRDNSGHSASSSLAQPSSSSSSCSGRVEVEYPVGSESLGAAAASQGQIIGADDGGGEGEISRESWVSELWLTLGMFQDRKMARLALIFWYTGFNQPYQLVTFGDRFFTPATLGLLFSLFYAAEVAGAYVSAQIVDHASDSNRAKAKKGYLLFFGVTTFAYAVALVMEIRAGADPDKVPHRNSATNVAFGGLAMAAWGLSDSQIQALAYWQIGVFYQEGVQQSRAVGFYKLVQSAGWCAGFALSPTKRLSPILQLAATAACYVVGLLVLELPPANLQGRGGTVEEGRRQQQKRAGGLSAHEALDPPPYVRDSHLA